MKYPVAILLLALASGQAQANGLYQAVAGDSIRIRAQTSAVPGTSVQTPLYRQVTGTRDHLMGLERGHARLVPAFTHTPLYRKVSGQS
jgi:hypothetical protein